MIDVLVSMPGFSAKEVEERATRPMEKLLWEIPGRGIHLLDFARPGESLVIVRFQVGEDIESSLVKLNQKLQSNFRSHPARRVVPAHQAAFDRRRADPGADLSQRALRPSDLAAAGGTGGRRGQAGASGWRKQPIIGGARRQIRVLLDPVRLASRNLSPRSLVPMLRQANRQSASGGLTSDNREVVIETGAFLTSAEEVGNVVVGVFERQTGLSARSGRRGRWGGGAEPVCVFGTGPRVAAPLPGEERQPAPPLIRSVPRLGPATLPRGPRGRDANFSSVSALNRAPRRHAHHRQAARGQTPSPSAEQVLKKVETLQRNGHPGGRARVDHAPLRRDGGGEVERTAFPHADCGRRRFAPDPAHAGLARVGHRGHCHSLDARR